MAIPIEAYIDTAISVDDEWQTVAPTMLSDLQWYWRPRVLEGQSHMLDHREMVYDNVRSAVAKLETYHIVEGMCWYGDARAFCEGLSLAVEGELTLNQVSGIVAVASANRAWDLNKRIARAVILRDDVSDLSEHQRDKVTAILALTGDDIDDIDLVATIVYGVEGNKTSRFHRAIMGDIDSVVVDVWCVRTMFANPKADYQRITGRANSYAILEDVIRCVAYEIGMNPRDLQAALWVLERGTPE